MNLNEFKDLGSNGNYQESNMETETIFKNYLSSLTDELNKHTEKRIKEYGLPMDVISIDKKEITKLTNEKCRSVFLSLYNDVKNDNFNNAGTIISDLHISSSPDYKGIEIFFLYKEIKIIFNIRLPNYFNRYNFLLNQLNDPSLLNFPLGEYELYVTFTNFKLNDTTLQKEYIEIGTYLLSTYLYRENINLPDRINNIIDIFDSYKEKCITKSNSSFFWDNSKYGYDIITIENEKYSEIYDKNKYCSFHLEIKQKYNLIKLSETDSTMGHRNIPKFAFYKKEEEEFIKSLFDTIIKYRMENFKITRVSNIEKNIFY